VGGRRESTTGAGQSRKGVEAERKREEGRRRDQARERNDSIVGSGRVVKDDSSGIIYIWIDIGIYLACR